MREAGLSAKSGQRSESAVNRPEQGYSSSCPKRSENCLLTSQWQRLVKESGGLVKHALYYWLMLAEGHLTRTRFAAMLQRIALLPLSAN